MRILAGIALIAAGIAPAAAQAQTKGGEPEQIVRAIYVMYGDENAEGEPSYPRTARLKAVETECRAMQDRADAAKGESWSMGNCADDYDVLCQCQDPFGVAWAKVALATRRPDADHAEVVVTFPSAEGEAPDSAPDLKFMFVRGSGGWAVDDIWEYAMTADGGEGSFAKRLTASIQDMRKELGMPAWKAP